MTKDMFKSHLYGGMDEPDIKIIDVFVSRTGGPLSRTQAFRIVRAAAKRAGVDKDESPHWLRHAHASHALDRGAVLRRDDRAVSARQTDREQLEIPHHLSAT